MSPHAHMRSLSLAKAQTAFALALQEVHHAA